jgi:hypothetical protein
MESLGLYLPDPVKMRLRKGPRPNDNRVESGRLTKVVREYEEKPYWIIQAVLNRKQTLQWATFMAKSDPIHEVYTFDGRDIVFYWVPNLPPIPKNKANQVIDGKQRMGDDPAMGHTCLQTKNGMTLTWKVPLAEMGKS